MGPPPTATQAILQQQMQAQQAATQRDITAKALALLRARLGEQERRLFERTGTLTISSRLWPGTFYLLRPNDAVKVVQGGRVTASLCVLATGGEPWPDRLMTILDLIASDERRLWQMANVSGGEPPFDALTGRNPFTDPYFYLCMSPAFIGLVFLGILAWLYIH